MRKHLRYTQARANLESLLRDVTDKGETVIIDRLGAEPVAMIAASELASLEETVHLFRSPKNARRLLNAMERSETEAIEPQTVESLRRDLGLEA
jgi:antitoxin YefM